MPLKEAARPRVCYTAAMNFPPLTPIRRLYDHPHVVDVEAEVGRELARVPLSRGDGRPLPSSGCSIAIAVGSRGIANLALIVRTVARILKSRGHHPFVVPAMGSHGGATPEGQRLVLAGYGVTEELVGVPIRSSMETIELPHGGIGNRVFMDREASRADATVVINRVKPHTDFHGTVESGLLKICALGLGKEAQAREIHSFGIAGLRERILPTARQLLRQGNIALGLALVENARDETMAIRAVAPDRFEVEERELLEVARSHMPSLPFERFDLLVIDEMGKDMSGTGIDPNIIGRIRVPGQPEPERPAIGSIVVTDLTEASHGNAIGVGLADVITRRLYEKIDLAVTYANVVTSTFLERGKIPVVAENDRQAVEIALRTCGRAALFERGELPRIARIRNTLHVAELLVSAPLLAELRGRSDIELVGEAGRLFGAGVELADFPPA